MMLARRRRLPLAVSVVAVTALGLSACGGGAEAGSGSDGGLAVLASFYPLQYAAERVGGDRLDVRNLTAPGAEPHDLELTPQDVGAITDADLVVYLDGFQPAVDDAVASDGGDNGFDVHDAAHLDLAAAEEEHDHAEGEEHDQGEHDHDHGATDPHFWLDPLRLADVGDALADRLAEQDPDGADDYRAGAADLRSDLEQLDDELTTGLASCTSTQLVTAHQAFGYLAERYGFTQTGISGISPDAEPSPAALAQISDFVRDNDVTTVYTETLVSPDVAEAVASEGGATTAVLDPIEGLSDSSAGDDYLAVMRANLAVLQAGQGCS